MKTLIIKILWAGVLTLIVVGTVSTLNASTESSSRKESKIVLGADKKNNRMPAEDGKTIVFNYNHNGKPLKLTFKGVSWDVALKEGANKCIDYYTDGKRAKVDEELYLDLIDVCVNPR